MDETNGKIAIPKKQDFPFEEKKKQKIEIPTNKSTSDERIVCSATWFKELSLPYKQRLPKNITYGVVILGHRHPDIIRNLNNLTGKRGVTNGENSCGEYVQGFLTNKDIFVDRKEAAQIALKANQIIRREFNGKSLYSEDIY